MTISQESLTQLDHHWTIQALGAEQYQRVIDAAKIKLVNDAIGRQLHIVEPPGDAALFEQVSIALEIAAAEGLDALLHPQATDDQSQLLRAQAQAGAYRAFDIRRVLPLPADEDAKIFHVLHLSALAYCGDRWADLRRWLKENVAALEIHIINDSPWDQRILRRLYDCWIRLLRKNGWSDLNEISEIVAALRDEQQIYEPQLLDTKTGQNARAIAFRLVALYHWAKATELLAVYMLQGEPVNIATELDQQLEAAREAAAASFDTSFEVLLRWLHVASRRMVAGSIWRVAQTVSPQVMSFANNVTRSRGLFELLPPQRTALLEQGLLDQASRAIVIDMPTSGGKTVLAQFRILQALNQFREDRGWVAYVAPTRALVAQLTRRLRTDFGPIGIQVELLNGAIELDSFEEQLLTGENETESFDVLVATPEKLNLVIRNSLIKRPLALVTMDEAHNIEDEERGLRIELLLATIKRDCPSANFLLLMPYVPNASEIARWLAPEENRTISLGTSVWRPNELVVGLFDIQPVPGAGNWSLSYETAITTKNSIQLQGHYQVGTNRPLNIPRNKANPTHQAAAMATVFSTRGTSIAVARSIRDAWSMARTVAETIESFTDVPDEIALVQRFLATEISPEFELIKLLNAGIAVHHAGLSDETRALIEWLTEIGRIKVLCATTTIAQGINFPVSSVFLASKQLPTRRPKEIAPRAFWNLAGRAGRMNQDSVGVVGIAAGTNPTAVRQYIQRTTGDLISRLVQLLDQVESAGQIEDLSGVIQRDQWTDFRSYIAHLWNEKQNLDDVLNETEQVLRNTLGYGTLQSQTNDQGRRKARLLLEATRGYARRLSEQPQAASLADTTGFAPEGVTRAITELRNLDRQLTTEDWKPASIFGPQDNSPLPQLVGVMMRIPELQRQFEELNVGGLGEMRIAEVAQAWVAGTSIEEIAKRYFSGTPERPRDLTAAITEACRGIYRTLINAGTWGLSALSKMPSSGILFDALSETERQTINNLPAMLYHGVNTDSGVLMRMNAVPRSIAEPLGAIFDRQHTDLKTPRQAREFLQSLTDDDWQRSLPTGSALSGSDYRLIWSRLSGEVN